MKATMGDRVGNLLEKLGDRERVLAVVPITGETLEQVRSQWIDAITEQPDMVEWRLDTLKSPISAVQAQQMVKELKLRGSSPVLATYRTDAEGGGLILDSQGPETYLQLVKEAVSWADAVDIELERPGAPELIRQANKNVPVIASFHQFHGPTDLELLKEKMALMSESGASVAKVAVMIESERDLDSVRQLHDWSVTELETPSVVIGMGEQGKETRLGSWAKRSAMSFAKLTNASAPGQPTLAELRASITG